MESHIEDKLLKIMKCFKKPFKITVTGVSMKPILFEGDVITVKPSEIYKVGDLIVYKYKDQFLLVHRILFIRDEKYYCKGDNSYRLEEVKNEQVIGKVEVLYRDNQKMEMPIFTDELIELSLKVNRIFCKFNFNIEETKKTISYMKYSRLLNRLIKQK